MTKARDLANIITGGFTSSDIPNLAASQITSGTFADARLPATALNSNVDLTTLNASHLTSGTVATARLGSGTASSSTFLRGDGSFATPVGGANTPNFAVYKNGDQGSISANTWTKVTTFTEIFDPQSTWDVSNNRFTPAVSGKYFIYLTMYVTMVDGATSYLAIRKNGTQVIEFAFPSGRTTASPIQLSAILESDTNDYFEFYVKLPASSSTVFSNGIQTKCGGFKLIE